jgi:hypothetical protein
MTDRIKPLTKERIKKAWGACRSLAEALCLILLSFAFLSGTAAILQAKGADFTMLVILLSSVLICATIIWAVWRLENRTHYIILTADTVKITQVNGAPFDD